MEEGSYLLIEPGMTVRGTDGDLGSVDQVVADVSADVFRGVTLQTGLLPRRHLFLAAEHVVSVTGDIVHVDLNRASADDLPPAKSST